MIDDKDLTDSTLRRILWDALKKVSIQELLDFIQDEDYIVRTSSAKRLQLIGSKRVFDEVAQLAGSDVAYIREISAFILGQLGPPNYPFKKNSIPILTSLSKDVHLDVKAAAIYSLGHLGDVNEYTNNELVCVLKKAAVDKSDNIRLSAAFAISSFRLDADIQNILLVLKQDQNPDIAEFAELSEELFK